MPTIRTASPADAPALKFLLDQLEHPLSESEVSEKIKNYQKPDYHLLVAEVEDKVVGFVSLHWYDVFYKSESVGRITAFCVDQEIRSKGIGRTLLLTAEDFFREKGCYCIEVSSNIRRPDAHRFYLQNGYIINSKRFIKLISC